MKKPKNTSQLIKQLQPIFNKFIRLRDKGKPCISCGLHKDNMQCGHYFAVGSCSGLRFDEDNTASECVKDNNFNESHLIGYGDNLLLRIGKDRLRGLKQRAEAYKREGVKWSRIDLREKIEYYKEKVKELE